jgi:superfamily II DNA or RNA helicase
VCSTSYCELEYTENRWTIKLNYLIIYPIISDLNMSFGEISFFNKPKSQDVLQEQISTTQNILGHETKSSLILESMANKGLLDLSEEELKKRFARRYEIYIQLLRDQRMVENSRGASLSERELEQMRKWLSVLNSLDKYIIDHHKGEEVVLRGKQIDVFQSLHSFLEKGGLEGYVKLPTGVGKTVLFTELVEAMGLKTLIVVPTKILVDQTGEKIEKFAPDIDFGKIYQFSKDHGKQVTIITYSSLVLQIDSGDINPSDYDCLILDEAHEALSGKRQESINKFQGAVKLGFSATPDFSEKKKLLHLLDTEIHSMCIREAIESGLLCGVSSVLVKTRVDLSTVSVDRGGEYSEKELEKAVNIAGRNKAAVEIYKKAFLGQLAVAYCVGIEHAKVVSEIFKKEGVMAEYISGRTPRNKQKELLRKFHEGEIMVLCNADLLIAGFDEPSAVICLNLRPTRSRIDAEQRGGRVLRLDVDNLAKHATVIDFIDENYSENNRPILFADVAGGVSFFPAGQEWESRGGGSAGKEGVQRYIDIEGVDVVFNDEEIMKIVSQNRESDKEKTRFVTLDEFRMQVNQSGIMSSLEYLEHFSEHPRWPSNPWTHYKGEWKGWSDIFRANKFLSYDDLRAVVIAAGVKTKREYVREALKHANWPSNPSTLKEFAGLWESWEDFCDTKNLTLEDLKSEIKKAGIKDSTEYFKVFKSHKGWPSSPDQVYAEWGGWGSIFEKKGYLSFENLKLAAQANNINGRRDYRVRYKDFTGWPAVPEKVYGEWKGWGDFLGH